MKNLNINSLFNFYKKTVIITGSNGQIGSSLVGLFLNLGAKVYGFDKSKNKIKHANFNFVKSNITNKKLIVNKINNIIKKEKKIDIIINNAGAAVFSKYYKRTEKELDITINTNIKGVLNIINAYVAAHKKNNLRSCRIINIGSIYGFLSPDFRIYGKGDNYSSEIYGATKAAVIQLTKYYSVILSKYKINVNCLSPGGIYNDKMPQNKKFIKNYSNRVPQLKMGSVENLFTGILFLASDNSGYVNGQNIIIDGGLSSW